MKKIKIFKELIFCVFLMMVVFIPSSIKALTADIVLNCDKSTVKAGDEISCNISVSATSGEVSAFAGTVSLSDNLELTSVSVSDIWQGDGTNGEFQLYTDTMKEGNVSIGSFKVKIKTGASAGQERIGLNGILLGDENFSSVTLNDISKTITIASTDARLQSLSVSNVTLSPAFAANVIEYRGTTSSSSVVINATAADSKAKVTGAGTKNLSIGDNTFTITVTAESGDKKNYTVIIKREDNRSNDSTLKSLTVDNGNINFKPEQMEYYDIVLPSNVSTFKVTAVANSAKAKVDYSENPKELDYGETDTIYITVTAENGTYTRYSVTATRKDDRSKNNNLKLLSINNQKITLTSSTSYTYTVNYDITKADIKAEAEDEKARVEVEGGNNLKVGSNKVKIVITAENNDIQTYTITVLRKNNDGEINTLSNNSNLKTLKIKNIDLGFKKDNLEYNFEVESHISALNIQYEVEDSKATAVINKPNELSFGLNKITILVTAENGNTSTYTLNVTRKEKNYEVENNVDKIIEALKNKLDYDELKITVSSKENLVIPSKVVKEIIASNKKVTYVVKDNEKDVILYYFIIDGDLFDSYTGDLAYGLNTSDNQSAIDSLLENRSNMVISFASKNNFPEGAVFKLQLSEELKNKQNLQLHTYESVNNELTLVQEKLSVENNYITLPVQTIQEYVVAVPVEVTPDIPEPLPNGNNNDKDSSLIIYAILGISIVALIIVLVILILKKKKSNPKKDSTVEIETQQDSNVSDINVNMENLNKPLASTENLLNENPFDNVSTVIKSEDVDIIDVIDVDDLNSKRQTEILLGISAMNINDYLEQSPLSDLKNRGINEGVVVVNLEPSSPLLPFGLKSGDVLFAVNGQNIANKEELRTLMSSISHGMNVTLTYYQNGQNKTININI